MSVRKLSTWFCSLEVRCFFFQAEDGIRDLIVTGVQTCALPISLSDLLSKALREVSLGRPRLEALDEMGRNSGVEDLHNFMQAVIQSEQFGTGIGKILRIQADEMRRKRRQRAQERCAQATLEVMLPMVGCIFPTLWIVLLGPAVLILMRPR